MGKEKRFKNTLTLTTVAIMSAVICVLGPLSINISISPVPISLTMIGIFISLYVLGWKLGTLSVAIYLSIGMFGMPVFSNFQGGISKIAGPTGGYLIGFIFLSIISGLFIDKYNNKKVIQFIGMLIGTLVCYAFGTIWLSIQAHLTFKAALLAGVIPYITFDIAKMIICIIIGNKLKVVINKKRQA